MADPTTIPGAASSTLASVLSNLGYTPNAVSTNPHDKPGYDPTTDPTSSAYVKPDPNAVRPAPTGTNLPGTTPQSPADAAAAAYYKANEAGRAPVDPAAVRSAALAAISGSMSAIDNTYAGLINKNDQAGQQRSGAARAVASRDGLLGTDFGTDEISKVGDESAQRSAQLATEREDKKNAIRETALTNAETLINTQKATVDKNNTDYINSLKTQGDNALALFKSHIAAGGSINDLSDKEYKYYLDATGMTPEQLRALAITSKPASTVLKSEVNGHVFTQVTQDPVTKKLSVENLDLGASIPVDYAVEKLQNGQLVFYPKTGDPTGKFIYYHPSTGVTDGQGDPFDTTAAGKKQNSDVLNWMRAQPDYDPSMEKSYNSDPVLKAKVIAAWKADVAAGKKKTGSGTVNPFSN